MSAAKDIALQSSTGAGNYKKLPYRIFRADSLNLKG